MIFTALDRVSEPRYGDISLPLTFEQAAVMYQAHSKAAVDGEDVARFVVGLCKTAYHMATGETITEAAV